MPGKLKGIVEYNGTLWEVECDDHVEKCDIVEIIERNNLKLKVKKIQS